MLLNELRKLIELIEEVDSKLLDLPLDEYKEAQKRFEPFEFYIRSLLGEREKNVAERYYKR